jgi:hypothetical protein
MSLNMPSRQVAKNTYQKFLDDIAGLHDRALKDVHVAVEAILKTAYRKIGERIVEVEQDGHIRAQYGSHLLEHVSQDMSKTGDKTVKRPRGRVYDKCRRLHLSKL